MDYYTDLIERLREQADEIAIAWHAGWGNALMDAADAIEALVNERDELAALRKQIEELEPEAWHFSGKPLYLLEGIKK